MPTQTATQTATDVFEITNPAIQTRVEAINNGTFKSIVTSGQAQDITQYVTDTLSGGELANIVDGTYEVPINDGTVNFIHYEGTGFVDAPVTSTTAIQKTVPAGPITQYNSNVTSIQRGRVVQPYGATVDGNGKVQLTNTPNSGSYAANAAYFLSEVNQAVCCASAGIMLGKLIDGALYNANPDYWDSIGMSSLNPETWNSITHGDDSFAGSLFNMVFGLNPDTNTARAYMDENAFAYMAMVLNQNGWFATGDAIEQPISGVTSVLPIYILGSSNQRVQGNYYRSEASNTTYYDGFLMPINGLTRNGRPMYIMCNAPNEVTEMVVFGVFNSATEIRLYLCAKTTSVLNPYSANVAISSYFSTVEPSPVTDTQYLGGNTSYGNTQNTTYPSSYSNGLTVGLGTKNVFVGQLTQQPNTTSLVNGTVITALYGTVSSGDTPEGISNQDNATLPDTSTWNDLASTLASLQNQYPDLFGDSITYNQIQPDGTLKPTTYVPTIFPSTTQNPWTDTQPTTQDTTATQVNPDIDLDEWLDDIVNPITRTLTETPTPNPNPDTDIPQNPSPTGTGETPTPTPPTGSASALWSVYHPSQAQVDSLGAWLWTDNIITQIQQVLQNPMEGIITLHKVFATPVDSGTGTIVIGRLDSEVPSATVSQQYVYVDCGSINCYEQFGNVFDYAPYTNVSLYLPFIGIVPLNVSDVMRSSISITYGVDVFTGACLAMVEVSRDGNAVNLYQYSGVCSVEYPLTGSVHSGLINGLLGVAGGVAGIAMASTGVGAVAGASAIAGGMASAAKTNNAHASGFSGNSGAMGIKIPYLILERPQTKVASDFVTLDGYPTNQSMMLGSCSGHVVCSTAHVYGITATRKELEMIESYLLSGVEI